MEPKQCFPCLLFNIFQNACGVDYRSRIWVKIWVKTYPPIDLPILISLGDGREVRSTG
jgi:hypothetical protein